MQAKIRTTLALTVAVILCMTALFPSGLIAVNAAAITAQDFESFSIDSATFGINTDAANVKSGSKSLHIKSTAATNQVLNYSTVVAETDPDFTFDVEAGAVYTWTGWVKFVAVDATKFITVYSDYVGRTSAASSYKQVYATTTDWQKIELQFTARSGGKASTTVNTATSPAECFVDNITVAKYVPPAVSLTSQGFETFSINSAAFEINSDAANVHEGAKSLHIKAGVGTNQILNYGTVNTDTDNFLTFAVEAGVTYNWTGWVKFTAVDATKCIRVYSDYVNRSASAASYKDVYATTTDWQKVQLQFTAKAGGKASTTVNTATNPAECYVDDISIAKYTPPANLTAQSFESFSIDSATFGINTDSAFVHEGAKSLHIKSTAAANQILNYGTITTDTDNYLTMTVVQGKEYVWKAWVKFAAVDSTKQIALYADYKNQRLDTFRTVKATTTDWQMIEVVFTAVAGTASIGINTGTTPAECYVDHITVTEQLPPPTNLTSQGFEDFDISNGTFGINTNTAFVHEGTRSLQIKSTATINQILNYNTVVADTDRYLSFNVTTGKAYLFTAWVKFAAADATKQIAVYADYKNQRTVTFRTVKAANTDWQKIEIMFTAVADKASVGINTGTVPAECYVDDIAVAEYIPPQPKAVTKIDFEQDYYFDLPARFETVTDKGYDGKQTRMLHVKEGIYDSATFLNWATTTRDTDRVFSIPVKPGTVYKWSIRYKFTDKQTSPYLAFYADYKNTILFKPVYETTPKNVWQQKILYITTGLDQTVLSTTFNFGEENADVWIDDIELVEVPAGVMGTTDLTYCEDFYNLFDASMLKSGSYIVKIPVQSGIRYTLGATLSYTKSSSSYLALSNSPNGAVMPASEPGAPVALLKPSGTNKSARLGLTFMSSNTGYVYLVMKNDDGALKYAGIHLFRTFAVSTEYPMGYDTDPNDYSTNVAPALIKGMTNLSDVLENQGGVTDEGGSPNTGDRFPAPIILISCLVLTVIARFTSRKRRECKQ